MIYGDALYHYGIGLIQLAVGLGAVLAIFFIWTGRRLKRRLDEEYGEPWRGK